MNKFICIWKSAKDIFPIDQNTKIKQVYVWLQTQDNQIVLVTKNDIDWQFPGGKPEVGETPIETAIREVQEETGLNISPFKDKLQFFGYYLIYEFDLENNQVVDSFLQLRYKLALPLNHTELSLKSQDKNTDQEEQEKIKRPAVFKFEEAFRNIKWLEQSDEYKEFSSTK